MKIINDYDELEAQIKTNDFCLLYIASPGCSVCEVDLPKTNDLVNKLNVLSYQVSISDMPKLRGQYQVFAAPTIILFVAGNEFHRQSRIIDFSELEYRINQYLENN